LIEADQFELLIRKSVRESGNPFNPSQSLFNTSLEYNSGHLPFIDNDQAEPFSLLQAKSCFYPLHRDDYQSFLLPHLCHRHDFLRQGEVD